MSDISRISEFLATDFPQNSSTIESVGDQAATIRQVIGHDELRSGGTVSGPAMMAVADAAMYVAIL